MKTTLSLFLWAFSITLLHAQHEPSAEYRLVDGPSYTQSKNVYLLTLFQSLPDVREILESDPGLYEVTKRKSKELRASLEDCGKDPFCFSENLPFSPDEVEEVATRLQELTRSNPVLQSVVTDHLIP
jgi:hypothetical protein